MWDKHGRVVITEPGEIRRVEIKLRRRGDQIVGMAAAGLEWNRLPASAADSAIDSTAPPVLRRRLVFFPISPFVGSRDLALSSRSYAAD